jgi:hypothetical protein
MIVKQMDRNAVIHQNTGMHQILNRFIEMRQGETFCFPLPLYTTNNENTPYTNITHYSRSLQALR